MLSTCKDSINSFLVSWDGVDEDCLERAGKILDSVKSHTVLDDYRRYGVDSDFDLIEAMYDDFITGTGNLIHTPWFIDFRIQCAMNPEYTEKCLESRAFRDVKDDILEILGDI